MNRSSRTRTIKHMLHGIRNGYPLDKQAIKKDLGQFLTPGSIAKFMASFFVIPKTEWRILDAGAGAGALSSALVNRLCSDPHKPASIRVFAYEIDDSMMPSLRHEYVRLQRQCESTGIVFSATILNTDFIECATEIVSRRLISAENLQFNAAILNPPYRKINSASRTRKLLRSAGIETSNLYTAFLALASQLLSESGELVSITPRSFCNGPYFRPFRRQLLHLMRVQRIHLFDSRCAAFSRDSVLQENVILHAVKSQVTPPSVIISASSGEPNAPVRSRQCDYCEVISPHDSDAFIHLVTDHRELQVRQNVIGLRSSLTDLDLEVSTGRVVDFRSSEFLRTSYDDATVPLIRPCHFDGTVATWPCTRERKPCAIKVAAQTESLLVPSGYYVLVKRFSAKEEKRRIVACVYDPLQIKKRNSRI